LTDGWYTVAIEAISGAGIPTVSTTDFAVDTKLPDHNVLIPGVTANYLYPIKSSVDEPTNQNLELDSNTKLYIDQYHNVIGSEAITESNLKSKGYSFIMFTPADLGTGPQADIFTSFNELAVSYRYYQESSLINTSTLNASNIEGQNYLLPLTEEYLAVNFAAYSGVHKVEIDVLDLAGNKKTESYSFKTHKAAPSVTPIFGENGWLGGTTAAFGFTSTDFTGFDDVLFEIDGVQVNASGVVNPSATLNLTGLNNGAHTAQVIARKGGINGYAQNINFNVDNTAPEISGLGSVYSDSANFTLTGTTTDAESGVSEVLLDGGVIDYNSADGIFTKSISGLSEGTHTFTVSSENNAGVTATGNLSVNVDTQDLIYYADWPYPARSYYVKFNSGGGTNLQRLTLQSHQQLYFCPENVSLHGNEPTVEYLSSNLYPFVRMYVEDRYSNGAETPTNELTATYSYYKNFTPVFEYRELAMESEEGYFTLPITEEYLGDFYSTSTLDDYHEIYVYFSDKAGNTTLKVFKFKTYWDPDSIDW
jgi:hypothetical protein